MSRLSDLELAGLDIEWYATDRCGQLAVLYTGSYAPLPDVLCANPEYLAVIRTYIATMPVLPECTVSISTDVRRHLRLKAHDPIGDYSETEQIAQRGLFAYDYSRQGKQWDVYFRFFTPSQQRCIGDLDPSISRILLSYALPCDFRSAQLIPPSEIV